MKRYSDTCRSGARQLAPQQRRQREAEQVIQGSPRQVGVHQGLADCARSRQRILHGLAGDLCEGDPLHRHPPQCLGRLRAVTPARLEHRLLNVSCAMITTWCPPMGETRPGWDAQVCKCSMSLAYACAHGSENSDMHHVKSLAVLKCKLLQESQRMTCFFSIWTPL